MKEERKMTNCYLELEAAFVGYRGYSSGLHRKSITRWDCNAKRGTGKLLNSLLRVWK